MDVEFFGTEKDPVPECDGVGQVELEEGFMLCAGCYAALDFLTELGRRLTCEDRSERETGEVGA